MLFTPTLCALLFIGVPESRAVSIDKAITTNCSKYQVDENIALAVAYHESRFRPRVVSKTKDFGMFQIHCAEGKHLPWCPKKRKKLFDPETNIAIGVYLLARAKKRCKKLKKHHWVQCYNYGSKDYDKRILALAEQFKELREGLSTVFMSCRKGLADGKINRSNN